MGMNTYYLFGLGNPGAKYAQTRHNAGRMVLEYFRFSHGFSQWKQNQKLKALISEGHINGTGTNVVLVAPETYMNESGKCVDRVLTDTGRIAHSVVVHDDLDLPLGSIKVVFSRGAGGHHGVESIINVLRTTEFARVRVGIAPAKGMPEMPNQSYGRDFVLARFNESEQDQAKKAIARAAEALGEIIRNGIQSTMNKYNTPR